MTNRDKVYRHLVLAVTDFSRHELHQLALTSAADCVPSDALVDDLRRTLAGHTQIGRTLPLDRIVTGPIPRDPATTRIAGDLLAWIHESAAA